MKNKPRRHRRLSYDQLRELAKKCSPPQSWWDEDFESLTSNPAATAPIRFTDSRNGRQIVGWITTTY